ncbi:MAG: N-acetylneuraminate synthase [Vicingaceae bacterium]
MSGFEKEIKIGKHLLKDNGQVFIVAEAGVNHGGDIKLAKKLIDIAAEAGADAVKFQAFRTKELIIDQVEKAPYQTKTTSSEESQSEMLSKLELSKAHYTELKEYCEQQDIIPLITPFDEVSLKELEEVGLLAYKVASTDTTNLPFLKKIAATGKPMFLSTGMTYLDEIKSALAEIEPLNKQLILMQCTANYPIEDKEANLRVIETFKQEFNVLLGYSDHSVGLGACRYAIPMGVCMIEKHFTLDKLADGPDHRASLSPEELKELVKEVRTIEKYLGSTVKEPTDSEKQTRKSLQKCLVAKQAIQKGEAFTEANIIAKRTGGKGISPLRYRELLTQKAKRDFAENEILEL